MCVFVDLTSGNMTEFQEKLCQQHEDSMHRELESLIATADKAEAEVRKPAVRIIIPAGSTLLVYLQE